MQNERRVDVTRKDIAQKAGVSLSVVSRAINNSGYVEASKKQKILQLAEEFGYCPHPVAMSLQTVRTKQLMFFCKDFSNSFYMDMYKGMVNVAAKRGYMVVLNSNADFEAIKNTMIDGIVMSNEVQAVYYKNTIGKNYFIPMVSASNGNPFIESVFFSRVEVDMSAVIEAAFWYLESKGHQKIGLVMPDGFFNNNSRINAFKYQMSIRKIKNPAERFLGVCLSEICPKYRDLIYDDEYESLSGYENNMGFVEEDFFIKGKIAARIFSKRKPDTTALICFNDQMAAGMLQEFNKLGIEVPNKLSVMGIDGSSLSKYLQKKLTSVSIFPEKQGEKCVSVLIDMIERKTYKHITKCPFEVQEGETVRKL